MIKSFLKSSAEEVAATYVRQADATTRVFTFKNLHGRCIFIDPTSGLDTGKLTLWLVCLNPKDLNELRGFYLRAAGLLLTGTEHSRCGAGICD